MIQVLIQKLAQQGRTVVYSSHILDVVERVCDRVVIIAQGRLLLDGTRANSPRSTAEFPWKNYSPA